ncbi:sialic acid-binding Ig-like lectin 10 isoform X5 [Anguilla anguilla]|uniref:sialic acid-binding Ig-like lectin 10 isoform X5 n=1 Tax=Anguilla anguilla TaxID=7936 RepID=UPI0015ABFF1E|nr:sialic acid-binding Ig-like lectin 10 isoform X5 [Anguilla anguilla]
MISFWAMVLFLIGDSACSFSEMTAKEGSCVTFNFTLSGIGDPGYIVWLKDAVWNKEANDYEGTIVHSLKPDKHNASEFENRVSVGSTGNLHKLTISNLTLEDSGKYSVRYYDKPYPPYTVKKSSKPEMSLEVQKNPCQVSVTGPELVQAGAEVILRCSTVGPCQNSPEWRSSGPGLASSEGPDTQGAKTAQLRFEADWSHDGVEFSCWPSPSNEACASRNITLAVEYGPRGTKIRASCCQGGVKAGESLTLTCETNARPEPDGYTWFRTITEPGGQRGPRRTKVAVPSNGQSDGRDLRFWRISAGDAGEYTCQAKNIISAEKSTALRVDVLYGPTGLTMSMDHEAREYSLVTIHCSVESFPLSELTLTWAPPSSDRLSDLSQHPKRLQGKSTVQSTRTSLAASFNASVEHAGRYTCRASNSEGWKETTKDLVVHYAPKDVRATANPEGEVNEKTNLDLSCEARSNPGVAAYAWFKLTGRGAREVGQGPVLTLRYLSEEHTGQYLCRTQNKIGEGNSSVINVTVRYGPRKTRVIHNMTSRGRPVEGSTVALMCSSQSYPPIRSYMWHVQKDVNVETLLRPGQNLTIGSDEEGIYYCSAENEISSSSSDPIEIRFDRFDITSLLIGAGASAGAMMMICLIMQLILKKKRHSQRSGSRMKDSEGIILSDVTAAQDEESIYANKTMLSGAGAVEKGDEGALHYATVDFSKRPGTGGEHGTGIVQGTSKRTSDYTVIRHKSREEREGGEEEGEGAKEEVEKEGQAELGTEREWAEARGEKKEETTYGNICPSRPTKRARQGLQQLPRNPAAEEEQEEQRQEENSAGGQENMYVEAMSPLMEGNGKGTAECEYAVVRKPK